VPADDDRGADLPVRAGVTETRSARKHAAIVAAATRVFLDHGYAGTSMDQVAREAEVSKQTVYKHFADKKTLFEQVMQATSEPMHAALHESVTAAGAGDDLKAYGTALLDQVLAPDVVRLRRMIAAEASRFPELAAAWHAQGPARTITELAQRLADAPDLHCADPRQAAEQLMWMLIGDPLLESLFVPTGPLTAAEIRTRVDAALSTFYAAYGP
jgi:TetR/AcrR family transcriptional regulator, mexJK operon transcriptional repressor